MMRILGLGVDIVETARVARALTRERFRQRVFSGAERAQLAEKDPQSWAGRFAAKEAVMKALGTGWGSGVGFAQIEILTVESGRPVVKLTGRALEVSRAMGIGEILVSISHSRDYAVASALAVGEEVRYADSDSSGDAEA
jgi:holo-[acyl-carrier protein] synthase